MITFAALRAANGEFLLNGHFQVSLARQQIAFQDTVLEYSGSDAIVERINGTGPIRSDIYVHVLSVGSHPPDISYEYMTAATPNTVIRPVHSNFYLWRLSDQWTDCDRACRGQQTKKLICMDMNSQRQTNERNCQSVRPKQTTRMCNIDCSTRWAKLSFTVLFLNGIFAFFEITENLKFEKSGILNFFLKNFFLISSLFQKFF